MAASVGLTFDCLLKWIDRHEYGTLRRLLNGMRGFAMIRSPSRLILGTLLSISAAQNALAASESSPVFDCAIETEIEAFDSGLPESGIRPPMWDVEFQFDTASGMLRYRNLEEGGFDPPRQWDVIQRGDEGTDWIAVYDPVLGPEQHRRIDDASVVLRIRAWQSDLVPESDDEQNRFYLLQYDVLSVGRCEPQ